MKSLGVVPEDIANLNVTPGVEVNLALPGGGASRGKKLCQTKQNSEKSYAKVWVCAGEVRKSPQQKVVLSDHLPIAFTVHWVALLVVIGDG